MDSTFEHLQQVLAKNIRQIRLARGLSQEGLSFDASIDRTYVSQLERGISNPSILVLHKVAIALHTDVLSLMVDLSKEKKLPASE